MNLTKYPRTPKKRRWFTSKKVLIPVIILLLAAIGAAVYFFVLKEEALAPAPVQSQKKVEPKEEPTTKATSNKELSTEEKAQIARFTTPTTGETWYDNPGAKELPLQGFLATESDPYDGTNTAHYYEVGKRGNSTIILSLFAAYDDGPQLYEKAADGSVKALTHPDSVVAYSEEYDTYLENSFTDKVTIDKTTHLDSLSLPARLPVGNGEYASRTSYPTLGNFFVSTEDTSVKTEVQKYGSNTFIKSVREYTDTGLKAINYQITSPLKRTVYYDYQPVGKHFSGVKWDNNISPSGDFGGIVRGCGASIYSVSSKNASVDADFVKAGTFTDGSTIYHFKSNSDPTVQKAWMETKDFYAYANDPKNSNSDKDEAKAKAKANITLEDFVKNHGIFAYKSAANGWLIYTNDAYAPVGGCAKPVVYLYPTTPTTVSVKVGADVKISDPLYDPITGWHAFAWPNGNLIVNGQSYTSLFWEGPGHGAYPAINSGTVVKRADAVATIRKQLGQQGLNAKETQDFMDYWADKIPVKPYVRLAWFNTVQMDELAPLQISPKPTTVIRVFLDMAGYDTPVSMPVQKLTVIPRTGFTAVEWGGLARGKLY